MKSCRHIEICFSLFNAPRELWCAKSHRVNFCSVAKCIGCRQFSYTAAVMSPNCYSRLGRFLASSLRGALSRLKNVLEATGLEPCRQTKIVNLLFFDANYVLISHNIISRSDMAEVVSPNRLCYSRFGRFLASSLSISLQKLKNVLEATAVKPCRQKKIVNLFFDANCVLPHNIISRSDMDEVMSPHRNLFFVVQRPQGIMVCQKSSS